MTVTSIEKDPAALTMTITSHFDAPVDRVWQLWADPRQLERWWGPPTYPATVEQHDLVPGGTVTYFMTGPEGDKSRGWWRVEAVEAPRRLAFVDGFADDAGKPNLDMPTTTTQVTIDDAKDGARMVIETTF
ncbi:MAG: SRPBCC family protein, partial [Actinomycetota bacterium]